MPVRCYYCPRCSKHGEWLELMTEEGRECPWCDLPMELLPSLPAKVRPGKYGKAGGINEHPQDPK